MKFLAVMVLLSVALIFANSPNTDAPTGFDNKSNGMLDDATHQADQAKFEDTETVAVRMTADWRAGPSSRTGQRLLVPEPAQSGPMRRASVPGQHCWHRHLPDTQ